MDTNSATAVANTNSVVYAGPHRVELTHGPLLIDDLSKHLVHGPVKSGVLRASDSTWVDPWAPWAPLVPQPQWPSTSGYLQVLPMTHASVTMFRIDSSQSDRITARLDVPGVKPADLTVHASASLVTVSGKRADTGALVVDSFALSAEHDADTAQAVLENGVLTVTVAKRAAPVPKKVPVEVR